MAHVLKQTLLYLAIPLLGFGQAASTPLDEPITPKERLNWFVHGTVGPASLTGGLISAGFGTLFNQPKEYGPHWEGFAKRYGMRFTGLSTGNALEAGLGGLWGEDPRYHRVADAAFKSRVNHVIKMTVLAYNGNGDIMPAYSRYIGIAGNNFLSNTWRAQSEATVNRAVIRIGLGFLSRLSGNAFDEFWPDVKQRVFHRNQIQKPTP